MASSNLLSNAAVKSARNHPGCASTTAVASREVSTSDRILVSVSSFGREIVSCQLVGFASTQELLSALAEKLSDVAGLLTVRLRNPRCGWTSKHTIRTSRQTSTLLASA